MRSLTALTTCSVLSCWTACFAFTIQPAAFRTGLGSCSSYTTERKFSSKLSLSAAAAPTTRTESSFEYALIFDCDGVIIETEELHRLAYNAAFTAAGLEIDGESVIWSVEYYDVLQNTVGGGKNKMFFHFRNTTGVFPMSDNGETSAPVTVEEEQALVDALQAHKTELYKDLIQEKATPRPGVLELMVRYCYYYCTLEILAIFSDKNKSFYILEIFRTKPLLLIM